MLILAGVTMLFVLFAVMFAALVVLAQTKRRR